MTTLAVSAWYMDPEVWVAAAFVLLVGFMLRQGVVSMVTKALDDRAAGIAKEMAEAKSLREEAQRLLDDSRRKFAAAEEEASSIIASAKAEAEALAAEQRQALQESMARRTKQAEDKIARAEAQAVAEVRAASVDVAMTAAEKLIADKAPALGPRLVEQSIRDLKGRLN